MKNIYKKGDQKTHKFIVVPADFASFIHEAVHQVCSTFALAREIEWSTRLFVKEMLEAGEEGIGTTLNISHAGPALAGETVEIIATFEEIKEKEIVCTYEAKVNDRMVAFGITGQRVIPKIKLQQLFDNLN